MKRFVVVLCVALLFSIAGASMPASAENTTSVESAADDVCRSEDWKNVVGKRVLTPDPHDLPNCHTHGPYKCHCFEQRFCGWKDVCLWWGTCMEGNEEYSCCKLNIKLPHWCWVELQC